MRVIVFGPTGGTGREIVSQALEGGHHVTAFTRNPTAVPARPGLTVVGGTIEDAGEVSRAVAGHDAVVSALGGRPWKRRARVCSTAMSHIVPAMAQHGVRRIVTISTFGAGDTRPQVDWLPRLLLFGVILRSEVADKEAMEQALAATGLDWIVVRVGVLADGPARGTFRVTDDRSIRGMGKIGRADVAAFMLRQLTSDAWVRRRPVVMY